MRKKNKKAMNAVMIVAIAFLILLTAVVVLYLSNNFLTNSAKDANLTQSNGVDALEACANDPTTCLDTTNPFSSSNEKTEDGKVYKKVTLNSQTAFYVNSEDEDSQVYDLSDYAIGTIIKLKKEWWNNDVSYVKTEDGWGQRTDEAFAAYIVEFNQADNFDGIHITVPAQTTIKISKDADIQKTGVQYQYVKE